MNSAWSAPARCRWPAAAASLPAAAAAWSFACNPTGKKTLSLSALARQFARPAHSLGFLARLAFRRLLIVVTKLHLPEDALALHFLFQRFQGLIDIVVANENLHAV